MKKLIIITIFFCANANVISAQYESINQIDSIWFYAPKTVSTVCDTLILRQICDYCLGEKSVFYPIKFSNTSSCLCYTYDNENLDSINAFIKSHNTEIKTLIIENPSRVIKKLEFGLLSHLCSFNIFGNDYDCDAISTLPKELLKQPELRYLVFEGVRFPKQEIIRIKKE